MNSDAPDQKLECTIPILPVGDLAASLKFYTEKLGFKIDWGGEEGRQICSVSRGGCPIMLSQGIASAAAPQWVWIGVEDTSVFEEWRANGVKIRQEPQNWTWAYEMKFEDIDGNVLWLGTEPDHSQPFVDA